MMTNMRDTKIDNIKIITDDNAILDNIFFNANELGTMSVQFNFLTKEITDKQKYVYNVVQRESGTNKIIGGETYEIQKQRTEKFFAFAGNDKTIDKHDTTTLTASQINEDAVYNWYDVDGNLIFTGRDLTVSPSVTTKYKLEIVSNIDGFKDYDEMQVTVKPYALKAIAPNPASGDISFDYVADGSSSAYLMIVNTSNGSSENHLLNISQTAKTINIANYSNGIYNAILICDGEVQNSKTFIKQ